MEDFHLEKARRVKEKEVKCSPNTIRWRMPIKEQSSSTISMAMTWNPGSAAPAASGIWLSGKPRYDNAAFSSIFPKDGDLFDQEFKFCVKPTPVK